jgi:hypothetical protein
MTVAEFMAARDGWIGRFTAHPRRSWRNEPGGAGEREAGPPPRQPVAFVGQAAFYGLVADVARLYSEGGDFIDPLAGRSWRQGLPVGGVIVFPAHEQYAPLVFADIFETYGEEIDL